MAVQLFNYTNHILYLNDLIQERHIFGQSLRSLAFKSGFKSGNYIQLIANGQRKLTEKAARNLSVALEHSKSEQDYFVLLARLSMTESTAQRLKILEEMKRYSVSGLDKQMRDPTMSTNWIYGVLYEMAGSTTIPLTPKTVCERLNSSATLQEVANGIKFLVSKGYLIRTAKADFFERKYATFQRSDDVRRIEAQQSHLRFLDIAKHRMNDDLKRREFQGLTVGISNASFNLIKERMREFNDELNRILSNDRDIDAVVRIQMAAFYLTR